MKLQTRGQVEQLNKFKSPRYLTTSFFFNQDKGRMTKKELTLNLKNLMAEGRDRLVKMPLDKDQRDSALQDLDKIQDLCTQHIFFSPLAGLAVFSCARENFWTHFHFPDPPRNRLIFDRNPYVRPLSAVLDEHRAIGVLVLDRTEAHWYELAMGEGRPIDSLKSDVPSKVREGGFRGRDARRIERHVAAHLHEHFKKAAQMTLDLVKKRDLDWLFVGCAEEYRSDVEALLHPYVKNKLAAWLRAKPSTAADVVIKEAVEVERSLKKKEEEALVAKLIGELEKGGLGVSGLKDTLDALNRGNVLTFLVTRSFAAPGFLCRACGALFTSGKDCPACRKALEPVADVVDEAIQMALDKHIPVKHITPPAKLDRYGKVGALLRYK